MKKRQKKQIIKISSILGVLVLISLFLFMIFTNGTREINLTKENFEILEYKYVNEKCGEDIERNPLSVYIDLLNFPIDEDQLLDINIDAYANDRQLGWELYDENQNYIKTDYDLRFFWLTDYPSVPFVLLPLNASQDYRLKLCFQVNSSYYDKDKDKILPLISENICLDEIYLERVC